MPVVAPVTGAHGWLFPRVGLGVTPSFSLGLARVALRGVGEAPSRDFFGQNALRNGPARLRMQLENLSKTARPF